MPSRPCSIMRSRPSPDRTITRTGPRAADDPVEGRLTAPMFDAFAEVPVYPLVFPIFWGAFAIFALLMVRRWRVFEAVHAVGPYSAREVPIRAWGVVRHAFLQPRMFRERRVGTMHYLLFVGSTVLLIGNINIVLGGLPQAIVGYPLDGAIWAFALAAQNLVAIGVFVSLVYMYKRRLIDRPSRLTLSTVGVLILVFITAVVSTEFLAQGFEAARYGDIYGAWAANAMAVAFRPLGEQTTEALFVA